MILDKITRSAILSSLTETQRVEVTAIFERIQFHDEATKNAACIICGTQTPRSDNGKAGAFYTKIGFGMTVNACTKTHAEKTDAPDGPLAIIQNTMMHAYTPRRGTTPVQRAGERETAEAALTDAIQAMPPEERADAERARLEAPR